MKPQELELPKLNANEARRGEGLLLVEQNNDDKYLIISGMNEALEQLLGYAKGEVVGHSVMTILGQKEAQSLNDDLEFEDAAPDFGDIFSRFREVKLRRRLGDEIKINCTLSRLVSQGHSARFQIVIPNEHERLSKTKLRDFIALNFEGRKELDPATGLPNYKTAEEFLPLLKHYFADGSVNITFAMLRLDRYDKSVARYGKAACTQLLMNVYNICRGTFRSEDLIFALSENTLGIVLFDISRESTRVVLNRLRWKIKGYRFEFGGKSDFSISTCIGFDVLDLEAPKAAFEACEKAMTALDANERNALVELGA